MKGFGKKVCGHMVAAATVALFAGRGFAADLGAGSSGARPDPVLLTSPWTVSAMPYLWLPWLQGDVTVKGVTGGLYINPYEVLEHLERMPWMSYIEARNGPLVLYNDIFYAKLGVRIDDAKTFRNATIEGSLGADFSEGVIEAGAAYQIAKWDRYTAIDLLAGARYWQQILNVNLALSGTLDTTGLVLAGNRAIARSGVVDWVDPLIGFRVRQQLAPGQELMFRADVGGFDAGSQFSWNIIGAYNFKICVSNGITYTGMLGYRALSVDYEQGSARTKYEYDVVQHGVSMYFGSAQRLNREHLKRLKALVRRTKTPWLSDHLCWGSVDGRYTHDLLPIPHTFEAAQVTAEKVRQVQDYLEIPIAVENVSSYAEFHASEMTEWQFLNEVVERADCGILLDVNNIYVSSRNHSFDPFEYVNSVPAERVAQIHVAGHSKFEKYILDTHDHPVIDPVWALYARAIELIGPTATLLEWDDRIPSFDEVHAEALKANRYVAERVGA